MREPDGTPTGVLIEVVESENGGAEEVGKITK